MVQAMENGHTTTDQQAMPGPGALVPAGPVKSVLPSPNLSAVKVDTQTRAIGLIQPPPDIRAIVDKTAQFVAKNGETQAILLEYVPSWCRCFVKALGTLQALNLREEFSQTRKIIPNSISCALLIHTMLITGTW